MVSKGASTDMSWTASSRDRLPPLLLDAAEPRDCTGVVGTYKACEWSFSGVLESRSIGVMLHPSPLELDAAGRGGVGGLPPGWLALQDLGLTTDNCDATHARLGRQGFSGVLLGWWLYERLSSW